MKKKSVYHNEGDWFITEDEIRRRAAAVLQERKQCTWGDCRFNERPRRWSVPTVHLAGTSGHHRSES